MTVEPWFKNIILDSLTLMMSLRLDGAPPEETIEVTAGTWITVLWNSENWCEPMDRERLVAAFTAMMSKIKKWPAPVQLIESLPKRPAKVVKSMGWTDTRTTEQVMADREKLKVTLKPLINKVAL